MKNYDVALMPGDGIGPEVTAEAQKTVNKAADKFGFAVKWTSFPYGAEYYLKNKIALPESAFRELADFNAMLLGAVGDPRVKPGPLEQGILLALRFYFDQYVNLRPAISMPGVPLPVKLADGEELDVVVVRENTEDLYMGIGGKGKGEFLINLAAKRRLFNLCGKLEMTASNVTETAMTIGLMSRPGIERITRYAFNLARERGEKKVNIVTKSNAVPHLYGFWDEVTSEIAKSEFPDMEYTHLNVDAVCYLLARQPAGWGVLLCPNLFGDIVSDLMSAFAGGLGLAAAGNIGESLSMFEPVHGSAPTIAKTGKANPLAAILSTGMMLKYLGEAEAAKAIEDAVRNYLASGSDLPIELGGTAPTAMVGDMVCAKL